MVIGNGFFSDTLDDARREMQERSRCEVRHLPYPTVGNIDYYISKRGDLYGVQQIQGRWLTRTKKPLRYRHGYSARLTADANKEVFFHLQVLVWCAFVLGRWEPDVELEFVNGDQYDVRPDNLRLKQQEQHPEYAEQMKERETVYGSKFLRVCWAVNYTTGLDFEDCKDVVQQTFIYLTTVGCNGYAKSDDDFTGLWIRTARLRAIDYAKHRWFEQHLEMDWLPTKHPQGYEFDWFRLRPGEKRQQYLRMYFEGNKPTEIARHCGVSLGTVSCEVSRSIQFMRKYFKRDIDQWNRLR